MDTTAHVRRSGDWWAVEVPDVPGLFTQVRRLEQVAEYVRDAAAGLGVDIDDVKVELDPSTNLDIEALAIVRQHLTALERMQREVANESRRLATHLRDQGLSVRDTGFLMGVSAQRVSQLTAEAQTPAPTSAADIADTWALIAEAARIAQDCPAPTDLSSRILGVAGTKAEAVELARNHLGRDRTESGGARVRGG